MTQAVVLKMAGEEWAKLNDKTKWSELAADDYRRFKRETETLKRVIVFAFYQSITENIKIYGPPNFIQTQQPYWRTKLSCRVGKFSK